MTPLETFETKAHYNKWLNQLTENKKDLILEMLKEAQQESIPIEPPVKVNFADLADEVKQDIENRIIKGVQTYGERLKINNGRNALLDAYEEILDLALYIKQELKERDSKISA